ncbi:hypothetical protein ACFT9I_12745 [Streptomyces sp. NPDC057137]|uniref:hypothetical protein n=1 Tax=Streptomyces sp. NPDC057137 TaxID=3346030 RepID=UPI00362FE337
MADRADAPAVPAAVRPAGAAGSVTVREYGTRYLRISVRYHGDARFSWLRVPGPAHDRPQAPPSPAAGVALHRVDAAIARDGSARDGSAPDRITRDASGARLALGEWDAVSEEGGVVYRVPGAVSVARLLPSGDETAYRLSVRALADVGRTLRQLHDVPWEFGEPVPPHHGVGRLLDWISGAAPDAAPDGDGARLRALAHDRLGPRLWTRLTDWAVAAQEPPGRGGAVLLHGAPSTGWLVPSPAGDSVLLTGEEVTGGDPALDLGWILGELHELRSAARRGLGAAGQGPSVDYPAAARALLAGYLRTEGSPDDSNPAPAAAELPPGTARAATLRLAIHMRDFASFVGWHEDLRRYADLLAETLDADGAPTLQW